MVNDDTIMTTHNWTNIYVEQLAQFYPPNVGVVGPDHSGGNMGILTYFFSHRTHIDIFHFFFPRIFVDWFADDWLTQLYEPHNVRKMPNVRIIHTKTKGTRYQRHMEARFHLNQTLVVHRQRLRHYLETRGVDWPRWSDKLYWQKIQRECEEKDKDEDNSDNNIDSYIIMLCYLTAVLSYSVNSQSEPCERASAPPMGLLPDTYNCGLIMSRDCRERFPPTTAS